MAGPSKKRIGAAVLDRHGRTFAAELGVDLGRGTPSPLFRVLCFALLSSTRISGDIAMDAAKALAKRGWTTAGRMAESTWRQRIDTLNRAGYARYDESTSSMLGDVCEHLIERYGGDLRKLREEAGRDPKKERKLLRECKGIGDVGADIFFREAQVAWDELFPFPDKKAIKAAKKLGLGEDAAALRRLASKDDLPRLIAALVRVDLGNDYEAVLEAAKA